MGEHQPLFKVNVTKTALKMEISLKDLEFLFKESPNNGLEEEPVRIRRGMRTEFADFVAQYITEEGDSETGEPPLLEALERAFMAILEGDEEFCRYPEIE